VVAGGQPEAPPEPEPEPRSEPRFELPPEPAPEPKPEPRGPSDTGQESPVQRALIADSDPSRAKRLTAFLAERQIRAVVVSDGGEALLRVFRFPPDLLVISPGLDGVDGRGVTEILRRSEVGDTKIIRITSDEEPLGDPEFEAEATAEEDDLPGALGLALGQFGLGSVPEAAPPEAPVEAERVSRPPAAPKPERKPRPRPVATEPVSEPTHPVPPSPAAEKPKPEPKAAAAPADPRFAEAERLARIIVSDIVLYNEDRFDEAARDGNMVEALKTELEEGRVLFEGRIAADVRSERDFIMEELDRVAAKRAIAS
jgi:CheY-like chemotaxis protein